MMTKDDNELVLNTLSGNVRAFEMLVTRYQKKIYHMVLRMVGNTETAQDLTQDIFVKVYENLGRFNQKYRFFSWIYRISMNETLNYLKKTPRFSSVDDLPHLPSEEDSAPIRERQLEMVSAGLRKLPAEYSSLLTLKYFGNLSYEEMAEVREIPVGKVRSRLFTAREQLRLVLVNNGFFENE